VKQVIVVRKDLKMNKGKIAGQVAHASVGVLTQFMTQTLKGEINFYPTKEIKKWLFDGSFVKIIVGCDSLQELIDLKLESNEKNIVNCLITDNGTTIFGGVPTVTCLAIGPDEESKIDEITGHLKLLR
jgi:PTH2 family peptidyl-tRNA hydrolase